MIQYYLKLAIRNIRRQKIYSIINILGLAIGLFVFLIIALYVKNEYSYDRFNPNYKRIYRMELGDWCMTPPGIAKNVDGKIPEIDKICRFRNLDSGSLKFTSENNVEKAITADIIGAVDSTFFDIFKLTLISGEPQKALTEPNSIVITEKIAKALFGNEDPLNKVINYANRANMKITGVIEDPKNFHIQCDAYLSMTTLYAAMGQKNMETLGYRNYLTYFLFYDDYNAETVRDKIFTFLKEFDDQKTLVKESWTSSNIILRPLKNIYFFKDAKYESAVKHGNKPIVNAFIIIAIFILVIAMINFINLTTARAINRAREVGVKKVLGSSKQKLILQFLSESIVVGFIAMILAITMLQVFLSEFNNLTLTNLNLHDTIFTTLGIILILLISIVIGLLAGLYPAIYMSLFKPLFILKGILNVGGKTGYFRKSLIILQFIIASILISGTLLINNQISYLKNKDLGFDKENIVNLQLSGPIRLSTETFKKELLQNPNISKVSFSEGIPGNTNTTMSIKWEDEPLGMRISSADPDFFETLNIKIKEGRGFSWDLTTDRRNTCLINETAAKTIGWDDPVGKTVQLPSSNYLLPQHFTVIGLFEDYHLESLHVPVVPLVIFWADSTYRKASIKISSANIPETIDYIEKIWNNNNPGFPFEYTFLDQQFDQMYKSEERMQKIAIYFSILAIFIACLGLLGLSAFMTQKRFKEIGIRKVLGSSIKQIVTKLSREFAILVIIANIIAIPLGWLILNSWLKDYPYRISIQWWVFPLALIVTIIIALLTVSIHSLKAAHSNPVDAIRHE